jgi:hypothetical protein
MDLEMGSADPDEQIRWQMLHHHAAQYDRLIGVPLPIERPNACNVRK